MAILETVLKILLGLLGLGLVVFVHELGHFLVARIVGIEVEAFCIGWGKTILKKKIGAVEYRLAIFPVGGYCKMRGEDEFKAAHEDQEIKPVKGTYYGASPWRRILVSLAGPLFNLLFAVLVLSVIWGIGFEVNTLENRIILASDIDEDSSYPATLAGLETGDRIIAIDGRATEHYHDVQEAIAPYADKDLRITVEREGEILDYRLRPVLDKTSGAGKIGVYFWTDPVIATVNPGSPAALAGLLPGDRLLSANGVELPYSAALYSVLEAQPPELALEYEREGRTERAELALSYNEAGETGLGISYQMLRYRTPRYTLWGALVKGAEETWQTLTVSLRSLALLFKGIDLTQAVSGPVRITYMVGDAAAAGFEQSLGMGILSMAEFLALISVALGVMNLLPLPVLDGGMVVLFIVELIKGRPLGPRTRYAFQTLGVVLIFGLMALAVFGDILFLVRR
ncbi:MAG: RIP metalloprotease RseP [Treponema sp.]|jgi:regulator of sigma E protease|nr:RIP metalloprotease RseP [Treponema sp.]